MDYRSNVSGMFSTKNAGSKMGNNLLIMIVQIVFCIFIHDLAEVFTQKTGSFVGILPGE